MGRLEDDPWVAFALEQIERSYDDICYVGRKDINKFGGNATVGASLISLNSWGQDEVYQTSNVQLRMTSTSASDNGKLVNIEYMDLTSDIFTFGVMEDVALDATDATANKVTLPTGAARWTRMYSDEDMVGDVYIYRDGAITGGAPDDLTTVHNHIPAGANQSQKSGTTLAHSNYGLLLNFWADVVKKTGASCGIYFRVREYGKAFRTVPRRGASSEKGLLHEYRAPRILLPGSDIEIKGISTAADTDVSSGFDMLFADIQGVATNARNRPVLGNDGWEVPNY